VKSNCFEVIEILGTERWAYVMGWKQRNYMEVL